MVGLRFGEFLRQLRLNHSPAVTQAELASSISRGKMMVSLIEQGKNAPPQGELLEQIIRTLSLDEKDAVKLRFLAASERGSIPNDIVEYFYSNPNIYQAILVGMKFERTDSDWYEIIEKFGEEK
ncbi:MAG: helix-turn-helix domain-containing protein [Oscillospiraceae bacterium]|nr:helix-turn-helix domain-containing protein [Oscillospiraceae bacterium]